MPYLLMRYEKYGCRRYHKIGGRALFLQVENTTKVNKIFEICNI